MPDHELKVLEAMRRCDACALALAQAEEDVHVAMDVLRCRKELRAAPSRPSGLFFPEELTG